MSDLISVIVSTYNREDALEAVLRSLSRQTDRRFEVIVADDGSGPATTAVIKKWKRNLGVPLFRVWHEHRGFRAAEIRNRALLVSNGIYFIFLDGDCLVRPNFVAMHRKLAEWGWFVTGSRIMMSELLTQFAMERTQEPELWNLITWFGMRHNSGVKRVLPLLTLPLGPLRKLRPHAWEQVRSANLGVWRSDLERVDGFDASFTGWGREDSDLTVRLMHAGIRRKEGSFATSVIHLWHPPGDRSSYEDNHDRLVETLRSKRVQATIGVSALIEPRAADAPGSRSEGTSPIEESDRGAGAER